MLASPLLIPDAAIAREGSVRITVQLEVLPGCNLSSGGGDAAIPDAVISFGTANAASDGAVDGAAASAGGAPGLNLVCSTSYTGGAAPTLAVDQGLHGNGSQRFMAGPNGAQVPYQLFQDQGRNIPYDPALPVQLNIPTGGVATPVGIYGRVASVTGLPDGHYSDIVTLTLTY